MKSLYILLLVAAVQGFVVERTRVTREVRLAAPILLSLTAIDPPGFEVEWSTVKGDEKDPVLGYKVKIWEIPEIKTYKYDTIDGVKVLVEEHKPATINDNNPPTGKPKEIDITGAGNTKTRVENIKLKVLYEIRVLAYTKTEEGSLSQPMRIRLDDAKKEGHEKDVYKTD